MSIYKFNKISIADLSLLLRYDEKFCECKITGFDLWSESAKCRIDFDIDESLSKESISSSFLGKQIANGYFIRMADKDGCIAHEILANFNWDDIFVKSSMPQILPFEGSVGEVIFRTSVLFHQGVVVHAAAIDYEGQGVIFSAPSGTGKSTQADLWKKLKGASILNGDRPCLRYNEDIVNVYGTPWSGTSNLYLNKKAPLTAVIMLQQAPYNEIRQLSKEEALRFLVPRCYLPYYDEDLMSLALDNIGNIIKRVPVYLLKCRPDSEAVELVSKCLK